MFEASPRLLGFHTGTGFHRIPLGLWIHASPRILKELHPALTGLTVTLFFHAAEVCACYRVEYG